MGATTQKEKQPKKAAMGSMGKLRRLSQRKV